MRSLKIKKPKYHPCGQYLAKEISSKKFKVSGPHAFTLHLVQPGKWQANGRSSSGEYKRPVLYALTVAEAVEKAVADLHGCKDGDPREMELSDAFAEWYLSLTVKPQTQRRYEWDVDRFLGRMESRGITHLEQLQRNHLLKDLAGLQGYDHDTIKNAWKPVRAMIRWAHRCWPRIIDDIAEGIVIRDTGPQFPDHVVTLSLSDAAEFILWLVNQPTGWRILPGVALQTLVGLRISEAHRLEWESVDLDAGTVTIQGEVKGPSSVRTIPAAGLVLDVLRDAPRVDKWIVPVFGKPTEYTQSVERHLKRWGKVGKVKVMDFRKTLETEAILRGWQGYVFNRYAGRSPGKDIQARHYISVGSHLMDLYREQVVSKLDEVLEPFRDQWNATCKKVIPLRRKGA